jgi:two-component system, OmpR family, phosphate regulon sensor histidine kinase PhoR
MNRLRWLAILMGAVILVITGFQVYWLRGNYNRERKTVEVRANSLFRETVRDVQDSIWQKKLQEALKDTSSAGAGLKRRAFDRSIKLGSPGPTSPGPPRAVRVLNLLARQMDDSLRRSKRGNKEIYISLDENEKFNDKDSTGKLRFAFDSLNRKDVDEVVVVGYGQSQKNKDSLKLRERAMDNRQINTIFIDDKKGDKFRIRIDSLFNDSIPVDHLTTMFAKMLSTQKPKLDIPFTILRQPEEIHAEGDFFRRPPPFDSFLGYKLQLGNTFSYLVKQITLPIVFSFFLVGLTVFSFVLLYRSLLRQHRLAQIKNDLISNITHELKTPIATVGVAIEALKNFNAIQDPEKTKEYLDISQNELQRLGLLVDKVLKLSMFENKKIEIRHELFDLEEVVNEVVASLRLQLEKYNARISVNTEGNLLIKGDRLHLLSVVFNLLDNALKYNKGNAAIQVDIKEEEEDIVLKVTDNGIGIPPQYKTKVFEKFFRVPTGDTHNAKGHGLGLCYSAQVIKQHHGTIEVDSHEGLGSTFIITLPKNNT